PKKQFGRRSVGHDMVNRNKQHVLIVGQVNQLSADEWPPLQIECGTSFCVLEAFELCGRILSLAQIVFSQYEGRTLRSDSRQYGAAQADECRAQRLMALDDVVERATERTSIQMTRQSQAARLRPPGWTDKDMIRFGRAFDLRDKPKPLL